MYAFMYNILEADWEKSMQWSNPYLMTTSLGIIWKD